MPSKKPKSRPELSIIIPAYCEERRIGKTLDDLAGFLKTEESLKNKTLEVLVVSADSPDRTHAAVRSKQDKFADLRLLKPGPKVGKGRDVQYGMLRAKGEALIFMDADLATPLHHLSTFYNAFLQGNDLVVGTRNLFKHHPNYMRRLISNSGNLLFRFAGGVWIEDSQCGFKLFSRQAAEICFTRLTIQGWGFDMEVLAIARANKLKMKFLRINDWQSIPDGTFQDGLFKNSIRSLLELAYILERRVTGHYKR